MIEFKMRATADRSATPACHWRSDQRSRSKTGASHPNAIRRRVAIIQEARAQPGRRRRRRHWRTRHEGTHKSQRYSTISFLATSQQPNLYKYHGCNVNGSSIRAAGRLQKRGSSRDRSDTGVRNDFLPPYPLTMFRPFGSIRMQEPAFMPVAHEETASSLVILCVTSLSMKVVKYAVGSPRLSGGESQPTLLIGVQGNRTRLVS